ncbi:MAG: hypothetical protein Q4P07_02785 [Ornithinimicrobium sp.]|uniref:MauE/DoxX family redox-associated membrane protein n=1 Tax=Ornithinimicrobium sp. TaxID=1977084 RepID=UPI0026DFF307|nr:MauE/DoxX family redox-associated membrane protein [Ornithinimicrobium sp.]MDO5739055.1 hypothetical protein [Ornithinimicrobium sp.]
MPTALALAPLTLAAVLILSGIAKSQSLDSTHAVMRMLRLPAFLQSRGAARLLIAGEFVTAALLLTPWLATYRAGALLALALFIGFWVVVVRAMGFDPRPTCGCFGQIGDHRINGRTVARNTLLVALAVVAATLAVLGPAAGALVLDFTRNDLLWSVLALALAAVAVMILGSSGSTPTSRRQHSPQIDEAMELDEDDYVRVSIPDAVLLDRDNKVVNLRHLARTGAQLLVLVNCWCGTTLSSIDRLPAWRERLPQLRVHLIFATDSPFSAPQLDGLADVWWDPGARAYQALAAGSSPSAVVLGADGLLAGGPVDGLEAVEDLLDQIEEQLQEASQAQESAATSTL